MSDPTRDELIDLCERGVVPHDRWCNRDSASAQKQLAVARGLLKAGCEYELQPESHGCHWLTIRCRGFMAFELGAEDGGYDEEVAYIPTAARLLESVGTDWYR